MEQKTNSSPELQQSFIAQYNRLESALLEKYGLPKTDRQDVLSKAEPDVHFSVSALNIWTACDGDVKDKKILDLGCGSNPFAQEERYNARRETQWAKDALKEGLINREYEPWGCRILHEMGADVVGIDIGNLDGEEFEHYTIDLSKRHSLSQFPDHSFDIIHSSLFLGSPTWAESSQKNEPNRSSLSFQHILLPQLRRLLKPGGILLTMDESNLTNDDVAKMRSIPLDVLDSIHKQRDELHDLLWDKKISKEEFDRRDAELEAQENG